MITNYIKIAFRKIRQHRLYSAINILGLTAGIAAALLLLSWTWSEVEMDRFHEKGDRLYQVLSTYRWNGEVSTSEQNPYLLVGALSENYPEVEGATAVRPTKSALNWERNGVWKKEFIPIRVSLKCLPIHCWRVTIALFISIDFGSLFLPG